MDLFSSEFTELLEDSEKRSRKSSRKSGIFEIFKSFFILVIVLIIFYFTFSLIPYPKEDKIKPLSKHFITYGAENRTRPEVRIGEKHGITEKKLFSSVAAEDKRYLSSSLAFYTRLGNHLFEFASLYGMSQTLNRIPTYWIENERYQQMFDYTREIMPGLVDQFTVFPGKVPTGTNITNWSYKKCCTFDDPERIQNNTDKFLHLEGRYYQSWKYFANRRDEILGYLRPPKEFEVLPKSDQLNHVTCVHARRGDFKGIGFYLADETFIKKSVEFIQKREKHHKRMTQKLVIFGDDQQFNLDLFPDAVFSNSTDSEVRNTTVNFVSVNSPPDDLLYSSQHCDTLLIAAPVSTFGWWMGYLSKGNNVFHCDVSSVPDGLYKNGKGQFSINDFYPPNWTALRLTTDNSTVVESEF